MKNNSEGIYVYSKKEEKAKPFKLTSPEKQLIRAEEKAKPFKLTSLEKQLIRAYVRYKRATCLTTSVTEILIMFEWDNSTHERYVPAYQDFFSDNPTYRGEFKRVRTAILEYIQVCKDKLDEKI